MAPDLKKKFEELEKKHRLLEENMVNAFWIVDLNTLMYEYATPSIEQTSGYTPRELFATSLLESLTPTSLTKFQAMIDILRERFNNGKNAADTKELEFIHKGGYRYWVEIRARIIREASLKLICISRDVTQHHLIKQKQDRLIDKLNHTIEEKENLLREANALRALLPICSGCKRVRDEHGKWWPMDMYIAQKTASNVTHTICTDCTEVFYGNRNTS